MWAQLMKMRLKPEKEQDLAGVSQQLQRHWNNQVRVCFGR